MRFKVATWVEDRQDGSYGVRYCQTLENAQEKDEKQGQSTDSASEQVFEVKDGILYLVVERYEKGKKKEFLLEMPRES